MINMKKRVLAGLLGIILTAGAVPVQQLQAEEAVADGAVQTEESALNYLYVESPYLEEVQEQNVVVSWGDGTEDIESMVLVCENPEGSLLEWNCSKAEGELYLFNRTFSAGEAGSYQIKGITYVENEVLHEVAFEEVEIEAQFQVEDESSIVMIDESNVNSLEQKVTTTLAEAGEVELEAPTTYSSTRAKNIVVALDPGHGGTDPGAVNATYGGNEKTICLKIAKYIKAELEKCSGIKVVLTRDSDIYLGLKERVDIAAAQNADIFISLHLNAFNTVAKGAEVYYPNNNYNAAVGKEGEDLAKEIQKELVSLGLTDRGIKIRNTTVDQYADGSLQDYYAVIRYSKLAGFPGIIIEHAFVDNDEEYEKYLSTDEKIKALALADAAGIMNYLDVNASGWRYDGTGWWYQYTDGTYPKNGWATVEGQTYYFDSKGYRVTGWLEISGKKYYLDSNGLKATNWQEINGSWYYFDSLGVMQKEWIELGANWYYLGTNGKMVTGFNTVKGYTYYFDENGKMLSGWQKINDEWYFFRQSGAMQLGWMLEGTTWYYFEANGKMVTGWKQVGAAKYYFTASGAMVTGSQVIDGHTYKFQSSGALVMKYGWQQEGSTWYYYHDGVVATGFLDIKGYTYYFLPSGAMVSGWQMIEGSWHYFRPSGAMQQGWLLDKGIWYYLEADGKMVTGWKTVSGAKYYFTESGAMVTGKQTIDGHIYHFESSGALVMRNGWVEEEDVWYYYDDGVIVTGFVEIEGFTYYFTEFGEMLKDWQKINGIWYYFRPSGAMHVGWLQLEDIWYYLEIDGKMVTGWKTVSGVKYYFTASGAMATGTLVIDGVSYTFNENGGLVTSPSVPDTTVNTGWVQSGGQWYYYENGSLVHTGVVNIMGTSAATVDQMVAYYNSTGKAYPASALGAGGASTIRVFCQIILEEAKMENVKAEVVFCQIMKETGWLQFGGDVKITQFNFGGLGATGNGVSGEVFKDVREGVRAQVQHLKAYASKDDLVNTCVDNRFKYVTRGCAPYVEWLGIQENGNNTPDKKYGWAASKNYGFHLCEMITTLLKK